MLFALLTVPELKLKLHHDLTCLPFAYYTTFVTPSEVIIVDVIFSGVMDLLTVEFSVPQLPKQRFCLGYLLTTGPNRSGLYILQKHWLLSYIQDKK